MLDHEDLPRKICEPCLKRVKIACELRNDVNFSQDIIENCLEEKESKPIPADETADKFLTENYLVEELEKQIEVSNLDYEYIVEDVVIDDSIVEGDPGELKPIKCFLCEQNGIECDFDTENPEAHFQEKHAEIQLTKCEFLRI